MRVSVVRDVVPFGERAEDDLCLTFGTADGKCVDACEEKRGVQTFVLEHVEHVGRAGLRAVVKRKVDGLLLGKDGGRDGEKNEGECAKHGAWRSHREESAARQTCVRAEAFACISNRENQMGIEGAVKVLNEMQAASVIGDYAIGGAVAAFLYIEPGTTFDLDIFIAWEATAGGLLDLGPIYSYLLGRGCLPNKEAIMVEGWAVQFLPAGTKLVEEALRRAVEIEIGGVATRVFSQEHLMAICLETGRPKDMARLVQFVSEGSFDQGALDEILQRYDIEKKFASFKKRFFEEPMQ